jgi:hypothetical protein
MRYLRLVLVPVLIVPGMASAQRQNAPRFIPRSTSATFEIKAGDFEELGPARIVIESRKELGLDAAQMTQLEELRKAFDTDAKRWADDIKRQHKTLLAAPPTLKRPPEEKPRTHKDSVSRERLETSNREKTDRYLEGQAAARRDLSEAMLKIRAAYDATSTATLALLTTEQRTTMAKPLEDASNELTARLRQANIR